MSNWWNPVRDRVVSDVSDVDHTPKPKAAPPPPPPDQRLTDGLDRPPTEDFLSSPGSTRPGRGAVDPGDGPVKPRPPKEGPPGSGGTATVSPKPAGDGPVKPAPSSKEGPPGPGTTPGTRTRREVDDGSGSSINPNPRGGPAPTPPSPPRVPDPARPEDDDLVPRGRRRG
jgi:hypothetical protein